MRRGIYGTATPLAHIPEPGCAVRQSHTQDLIHRMSQKVTEILALHVGARGAAKQRQDKRGPHKHPSAQVMHPTEPCRDRTTPTRGDGP